MVNDYFAGMSVSEQLQLRIIEDPRFENVKANDSGPIDRRVLTNSGSVVSVADKSELLGKADQEFWVFKTTVTWRVRISQHPKGESLGKPIGYT